MKRKSDGKLGLVLYFPVLLFVRIGYSVRLQCHCCDSPMHSLKGHAVKRKNCSKKDSRDQHLLVIASHDFKQILNSLSVLLVSYAQQAGKYASVGEMQNFSARVDALQCASAEMALFLDEMMAVLERDGDASGPLTNLAQQAYQGKLADFLPMSQQERILMLHDAPQGDWLM